MSREYKIIIMGSCRVGKSALTLRFIHDIFLEKYDPTIEDSYRTTINLDNDNYIIEILDTAGTEEFMCMRDLCIKDGHGFVLVYSIDSYSTLFDLYNLNDQINRVKDNTDTPKIIAGNKCDLQKDRKVTLSEATIIASRFLCEHFEVSAKNSKNIKELFHSLIRIMNNYYYSSFKISIKNKKLCTLI